VLLIVGSFCTPLLAQRAPILPRDKEVALALSAAPEHLRDGAGVWALEAAGYVKVRESANGLSCLVNRDRADTQEPICWDAEGTEAILPYSLEREKLRGQGRKEADVEAVLAQGFVDGRFRAPRKPGVAYMLSTENHVFNGQKVIHYAPHIMVYAPYATNKDIGAGGSNPFMPWVLNEGSPHAYIIVMTGKK
jgi:hypothetical protein